MCPILLSRFLAQEQFVQLVTRPTHIAGGEYVFWQEALYLSIIKACLLGFYKCNINGLILNWVYIKFAICQVSWTRHTWERLPRGEMWTWRSMATTLQIMIVFVYFLMKSNSVENIIWWYCVWDLHMVVFEIFTWNIYKLENITWWYCLKPSHGTFKNFSDPYRGK